MHATTYYQFFLNPTDPQHRRYEAMRALFVDHLSLQEVANRFGMSYGTVANWASEFRNQFEEETQPPFFANPSQDDHPAAASERN